MTSRLVAARGLHGTIGCAQPSCRRELPGIWHPDMLDEWPAELVGLFPSDGGPATKTLLYIAVGWRPGDDGIWRVTERGRRRGDFLSGRARPFRNVPDTVEPVTGGRANRSGRFRGQIVPNLLSAVAECPFCHAPQRLDADGPRPAGYDCQPLELGRHRGPSEKRQD